MIAGIIIAFAVIGVIFLLYNYTYQPLGTQNTTQATPQNTQATTINTLIKNFAFSPQTITIKAGSTVIWTNKDSTSHTITSNSGNELNSQLLSIEGAYTHTFNQKGTFNYHCTPHPSMKGTAGVE